MLFRGYAFIPHIFGIDFFEIFKLDLWLTPLTIWRHSDLKYGFCKGSFIMNAPLASWAYMSSLLGGFAVAKSTI